MCNGEQAAHLAPEERRDTVLVIQAHLVHLDRRCFGENHLVELKRSDGLERYLGDLELGPLDGEDSDVSTGVSCCTFAPLSRRFARMTEG